MDLLFFLAGVITVIVATVLLIGKLFTRQPVKKVLIMLSAGAIIAISALVIGAASMSPEEKIAAKERQEQREEREEKEVSTPVEIEPGQPEEEIEHSAVNDEVEGEVAEDKKPDDAIGQPVSVRSKEFMYSVFESGDDGIDETVSSIEFDEDEKILMATVKGKDGWSEKSIGLGFYEDSTTVYRELSKDERIEEIWLTITFPMQDTYGNVENQEVMATWLSRETMDKVNWKNFDYRNLLDIVDGKRIYPQFVQ